MATNTIERFDIELLINSSNFTKKLQQLEKQVMQASKRMEKNFENAFNLRGRGALKMQGEFNRVVMASARAGRIINQNLQFTGANQAINQWGANVERVTARARQSIGRANAGLNARGGGLGGRGGAGSRNSSGLTQEQRRAAAFERATNRAADRIHAQQYGDVMSRLQRGGYREQASQFRQQMYGHYQSFRQSGDMAQFQRGMRETIRTQRDFLAAQTGASRGIGAAADGLIGKFGALAAGVFTLQKAIEVVVESVRIGVARQQAQNRLSTSFGKEAPEINKQVSGIANEFGINQTAALGQVSTLRATLPREDVNNQQIIDLMRDESVAKTSYGLTDDQIDRLNVGISQMMSSGKDAKVNAQDLNQIRNSFTEYLQVLRAGSGNDKLTRADVLNMKSEDFFKFWTTGLAKLNQQSGAYEKAREAFATKQMQMQNAQENWLNSMFTGEESGFKDLMASITGFFNQTSGGAETLGEVLGWVARRFTDITDTVTHFYLFLRGVFGKMGLYIEDTFNNLPKPVQDALNKIGNDVGKMGNDLADAAIGVGAMAMAAGSLKTVLSLLGLLKNGAGNAAGGEAGAGSGLIRWGFQLYALYELAAHADQLNKAAVDSANSLRQKMGLEPVKQRTHEEIMNDPNTSTFQRIMNFDPTKDIHRVKKFFSDTPLAQGNWTGSTEPALYPNGRYKPQVPLTTPTQQFNGKMSVDIKLNGQQVAQIAKSVTQDFHESRSVNADLMMQPWGNHPSSPVPFKAPVQQ
ncbi:hypothetical protein [Enterobacter mori]